MKIMNDLDIVQRLLTDKPSFHQNGEARWDALPETLEAIRRSVKRGDSTIEIGVGVSTVVFACSGSSHTAISPEPAEHQLVRDYCQRLGIDDSRVSFVTGSSDDVLPSLLGRDRTLDVAFIDGAHSYPVPAVDWYYTSRALKVGGKLLMDDITIPAAAQVFRHMKLEPYWRLDGIFDDRAAAFTLLNSPGSDDDWSLQPFNRRYPDFSFVSLHRRLRLETEWGVMQIRRRVGQRYPGLRRVYKRGG